jgi:anaerobic magnesium-protoporphyrin IX monomethyl ester cyclase
LIQRSLRVLVVDLNNFARYPTLAVGYLIAALRDAGHKVELFSPLAHGVPAVERERTETPWDQLERRVFFSSHPGVEWARERVVQMRSWWLRRPHPRMIQEAERALELPYDVVLLSSYVDHYEICKEIARLANAKNIPVLLGGPVFNVEEVVNEWLAVPGITAIYGGEADVALADVVSDLAGGGDLTRHPGIFLPDGRRGPHAPPLLRLDQLRVPDFTDFPWDAYPQPVIPMMTGRGCSWAACRFCGDVITANGRTFRTRPVESVLDEMQELSERHAGTDFIFLDIKLNSDPAMWHGLIENVQSRVPGARWIGSVHVGTKDASGLTREVLAAAHTAGLTRVTFGLESGSQVVLDAMDKGTTVEENARFLRDASEAGISVRATVMQGYPGETTAELQKTVQFLEDNQGYLDRVRLTRFKPLPSTRFHTEYERDPEQFSELESFVWDFRFSRASYIHPLTRKPDYRKVKADLLRRVYAINKKPLRPGAEQFDGLM